MLLRRKAYTARLLLRDGSGSYAATTISFPATLTLEAVLDKCESVWVRQSRITGCVCVEMTVECEFVYSQPIANSGSSLDATVVLVYDTNEGLVMVPIPGWNAPEPVLGENAAQVAAIGASMGGVGICNPSGEITHTLVSHTTVQTRN